MDLTKHGFETLTELPRELMVNELLGRRLFVDLKKRFPKLDTVGEPARWDCYVIDLGPYRVDFSNFNLQAGIRYVYNRNTNQLLLTYTEQATPIESRTLTQHLMNEINRWQKKKNLKR